MSGTTFELAPFPGMPAPEGVRISGEARRSGAMLNLEWRLESPEGAIALAPAANRPERRRELWEETCFEFFLTSPEAPGYWEFNLAPSGHWNVFRFDAYRAGMRDEAAFQALPFDVSKRPGTCTATATIDLTGLGLAAAPWSLAIAMVVAEPAGRISYWALAHPGAEADFHHPDAFVLHLEP